MRKDRLYDRYNKRVLVNWSLDQIDHHFILFLSFATNCEHIT